MIGFGDPTMLQPQRHMTRLLLPVVFWFGITSAVPSILAENWPGWRGPQRCGVSTAKNIPTQWSATEGIAWKKELPGSGIASPIIWGDKVLVTAADGQKNDELHLICLDRKDGKELWHLRLWGTSPTRYHSTKGSMASPTPVTDGDRVYAFFSTGDVFAVDLDGHLCWHRSLATEYGSFENRFSATSSPLLYRDLVVIQCDHFGDSYVVAVDKTTGADRWRVERPETWVSWSSPQLARVNDSGAYELILCSSEKIDGLEPETGRQLWTLRGMQHECIPTPVLGHQLILAVSGPRGTTFAFRPGGRGDITESHVVWQNNRGAPYVPSGILVGDYYYLATDQGIANCFAAQTGKRVWQKRLPGSYTASPIAADGKIFFTNDQGETVVVQANVPKYRELAHNPLNEPVVASSAIAAGHIYIRTLGHLLAIDGLAK